MVKLRPARPGVAGGGLKTPESTTQQVGQAPDGFGKYIQWAPGDQALALMVFLNTADSTGVAVLGVNKTDTIELVSAAGNASFSEGTANKGIPAAIGIVAAGANIGAAAFGFPEAAPLIGAASKFAQEQFAEKPLKTKQRDAYGVDPGSQHKARQEGGVLICMPGAHGTYSSGEDEKFWIKEPGNRIDRHRPDHVKKAFFIRRGMGPQTMADAGDLYMLAWDHDFRDNLGFYELHVILRRGSGRVPPPPEVE
jgi:hypothetical protein